LPVVLRSNIQSWSDPRTLAAEIVENLPTPIMRGGDFSIAEAGPDGVRFHLVRLRKTDGKVAVRGTAALDPTGIAEAEAMERQRREAEEAVQRAARAAATRRQPLFTTD